MLEDGFAYPARGEASGRLILGTLLTIGSSGVIPALLLAGYWIRSLRTTVEGQRAPPAWTDYWGLFVDGLRGLVVVLVYALVPTVLAGGMFVVLGIGVAGGGGSSGELVGALAGLSVLGAVVFALVGLVLAVIVPAATVTFVADDAVGAAFGFGTVAAFVFSLEYVGALVQLLVVATFAGLLASTVVLAPLGLFWAGLSASRILGTAYRSHAAGREQPESIPDAMSPSETKPFA